MKDLKNWITKRIQGVGAVFMAFPAVVVFLLFAAIGMAMRMGAGGETMLIDSLCLSFLVGAVSNLLLMLLIPRRDNMGGWQLAITGAGIIIPCGVFLLLYGMEDASGLWKARVLAFIAVMLIVILRLFCKRNDCGITQAVWLLLRRWLVGVVFGGAVFAVGLLSIFLLFVVSGMPWSTDIIAHLSVVSGFVCLLFVLRLFVSPEGNDMQRESVGYRQTMEKVISYILIPLALCYFLVELLLIGRAIIYNNWPQATDTFTRIAGLMGVGALAYLLGIQFNNWMCRIFRLVYPCAGLLVLGVGAWRLMDLILHYGISEARYFVILGIVVFVVFLILILVDIPSKGRIACLLLAVMLGLSVMPYVNYHSVAAYSQLTRAESIMNRYGMLTETGIVPPASMSETDRLELSRAVQYLYDEQETAMAKWLPIHFNFYEDYAEVFGIGGEFDTEGQSTLVAKTYRGTLADKYYRLDGYDLVLTNNTTYNLFNFTAQDIEGEKGTYTVRFSQVAGDSLVAVVTRDGQTLAEVDVTEQLLATARYLTDHASNEKDSVVMPLDQMTVVFETEQIGVRVILKSVSVTADKVSRGLSTALTDIILIDEK